MSKIDYTKPPPLEMIEAMKKLLAYYEDENAVGFYECPLCAAAMGYSEIGFHRSCNKCAYAYYAPEPYGKRARDGISACSTLSSDVVNELAGVARDWRIPAWVELRINQLRCDIKRAEAGIGGKP